MVESPAEVKGFIFFHVIANSPGNPIRPLYERAAAIEAWAPAPDEYVKLGAAAYVTTAQGTFYVQETFDEVTELMRKVID